MKVMAVNLPVRGRRFEIRGSRSVKLRAEMTMGDVVRSRVLSVPVRKMQRVNTANRFHSTS